jgi:hypothetical protein
MTQKLGIFTGVIGDLITQEVLDRANNLTHFYSASSVMYGDDSGALSIIMERTGVVASLINKMARSEITEAKYMDEIRMQLAELCAITLSFAAKRDVRPTGG